MAGIDRETVENQTAYIAHWRKAIEADSRLVVQAASAAQKAADCILGAGSPEDEPETPAKPGKKKKSKRSKKKKDAQVTIRIEGFGECVLVPNGDGSFGIKRIGD